MIRQGHADASGRARNLIWNAAGRYGFEPVFAAFHANGQPDVYFDTVIGLTEKWLGLEKVAAFFDSFRAHRRSEEFQEILWLGIENYVYEKELPERPALPALRRRRGEAFFAEMQTLSEQQMALQSMAVFRQQQYRWALVTGRALPLLRTKDRQLAEALFLPADLPAEKVTDALRGILREYFGYDPAADPRTAPRLPRLRALAGRIASHEYARKDLMIIRTGTGTGDPDGAVAVRWDTRAQSGRTQRRAEEDMAYIRTVFGPSSLPEEALRRAEALLCTGSDDGCRLWAVRAPRSGEMTVMADTSSKPGSLQNLPQDLPHMEGKLRREALDVRQRRAKQRENNLRFCREHSLLIRESIKRLTTGLEVLLASFLKGLPERSRAGQLQPERAFRASVLRDPRIFVRSGDDLDLTIRVDLLLDASQSRMNSQERIASEAFIIARSLVQNRVPVRVTAFRSLRGCTVLEQLKAYDETACDGIMQYCAGGWNRDGLALKFMDHLMVEDKSPADLRLLLILTDASPNDAVADSAFGKNYEGKPAVDDAAAAVKQLRADGILPAAVFHGSTSHLENVYRIYGDDYVRVMSLQQFSAGVADLLIKILQKSGG